MFNDPGFIAVIGRTVTSRPIPLHYGLPGGSFEPTLNLTVAIRKIESATSVVEASRQIGPVTHADIRIHPPIVDAIGMFIHHHP